MFFLLTLPRREAYEWRPKLPFYGFLLILPKWNQLKKVINPSLKRKKNMFLIQFQHMANYSPISSRTHRLNTAPGAFFISTTANPAISASTAFGNVASTSAHANAFTSRRRESMNSSIGATSIRRLLTVNRGCRHKIPMHIRAKVAKNFTFLIVAHGLMCAVLIPLFGLQVNCIESII